MKSSASIWELSGIQFSANITTERSRSDYAGPLLRRNRNKDGIRCGTADPFLLVQLRAYFKQEPLKSITAKRITEYRAWRAEQKVDPATLNPELGATCGA